LCIDLTSLGHLDLAEAAEGRHEDVVSEARLRPHYLCLSGFPYQILFRGLQLLPFLPVCSPAVLQIEVIPGVLVAVCEMEAKFYVTSR
jgi:hypothetical protein